MWVERLLNLLQMLSRPLFDFLGDTSLNLDNLLRGLAMKAEGHDTSERVDDLLVFCHRQGFNACDPVGV